MDKFLIDLFTNFPVITIISFGVAIMSQLAYHTLILRPLLKLTTNKFNSKEIHDEIEAIQKGMSEIKDSLIYLRENLISTGALAPRNGSK